MSLEANIINIKKWTGLKWNSILRKTENREGWRSWLYGCDPTVRQDYGIGEGEGSEHVV